MILGYSFLQILILVIVIAAAIAILMLVLRKFGITIDPIFFQIFWILVFAFLGVAALIFLFSLVGSIHASVLTAGAIS